MAFVVEAFSAYKVLDMLSLVPEAFVYPNTFRTELYMNPATPPDRRAGVAAVEVQKGIRPDVSGDEVETVPAPPPPPVLDAGCHEGRVPLEVRTYPDVPIGRYAHFPLEAVVVE